MRLVGRARLITSCFVSALGLSLLGPRAQAQQSPQARAAFDEALALVAQRRPAEAIAKLKTVTALEPAFAPAWFALASAARRAGSCADAIPAYRRYADLRPAETEPLYGLGLCLRDTGDRAGALTALQKFIALEHRPSSAKWIENARAAIAALEPPAAAPPPGVPVSKSRAAGLYAEAQRLRDGGRIEEALAKFRGVADADPDLMTARAAWGELLIKIRRDTEAIAVFRAALQRNQQYPLIWYELAFTLRESDQLTAAVDAYQRYIQLRPNDPDPYYGLAKTWKKLGRADDARRAYESYLALEKRPTEGRFVTNAQAELAALRGGGAGGLTPAGGVTSPPPRE